MSMAPTGADLCARCLQKVSSRASSAFSMRPKRSPPSRNSSATTSCVGVHDTCSSCGAHRTHAARRLKHAHDNV
eukprot:5881116-Pleurochrysis_carterae.AAC.2